MGPFASTPAAQWIDAPGCEGIALAKSFSVPEPGAGAVLRIAAPGFYEAWLDGKRVGDAVLDPAPSDFTKRVYFREYPLALAPGGHELRVLLGHGWYCQRTVSAWNNHLDKWRAEPCLLAEIVCEAGGEGAPAQSEGARALSARTLLVSDSSWRLAPSPLAWDDFREGEVIDPSFALPRKGFADGAPATVVPGPSGSLQKADFPPARIKRRIAPKRVWQPKAGGWIFDFGEDIAGWAHIAFSGGRRGDMATIRYDERVAPDGEPAVFVDRTTLQRCGNAILWPDNARSIDCFHYKFFSGDILPAAPCGDGEAGSGHIPPPAMQQDRFVLTGAARDECEPRFVWHGFRYVWVRGVDAKPEAEACEIRTDFAETGSFECSDARFNALVAMADRAYKANFADGVPTDCPHREKNGWTGDAQIACELAQYAYDNTAAYVKWCRDLVDAQRGDGCLPGVVPTGGWGFCNGPDGPETGPGYGPAWGAAIAIVPWMLYAYRGVTDGLDICYDAMKRYAAFEVEHLNADGMVPHGLGDWICTGGSAKYIGPQFVGTAYLYATLRVIAETARMKGLADDNARFSDLAAKTLAAFNALYAKGDGLYGGGSQTEQAIALTFGFVPGDARAAAEARLVDAVRRADGRFDGGLAATKHVFRALSRAGRTDLAFSMLMAKGSPGFMHWLDSGGTALWEDWWTGASRNHIMFGDFACWARQWLCGIRLAEAPGSTDAVPLPAAPGFRRAVIAPDFIAALDGARCSVLTPFGKLSCAWRRVGGRVEMEVEVPQGCAAEVHPPDGASREIGPGKELFK